MNRHGWFLTAVAMALGVALAGTALAADPKVPGTKYLQPVVWKPQLKQWELRTSRGRTVWSSTKPVQDIPIVKGQPYKVIVTVSTPPLPGLGRQLSGPPVIPKATKGEVKVLGVLGPGYKPEFQKVFSFNVPEVKPGKSYIIITNEFEVPWPGKGGLQDPPKTMLTIMVSYPE